MKRTLSTRAREGLEFARALEGELERVLQPLDSARPLPTELSTEASVFSLERELFFDRCWAYVGAVRDGSRPGEFTTSPLGRASALVVRGDDLELRAFHNLCRHRPVPLVEERCGRAGSLRCPYHGWTYRLDGAVTRAPGWPPGLPREGLDLAPMRLDTWGGLAFACADPAAPPLREAEAPPWLAEAPLDLLVRAHEAEHEVAANWKLLAQNFQESLHFASTHPALERLTPSGRATSWSGSSLGPWLGGVMPLAPHAETVSLSGELSGRVPVVPPERRTAVHDALLFPLLFTSLQPDYLLLYRLEPLAVGRTRVRFEVRMHPASVAHAPAVHDVVGFWTRVNQEDRALCERQQRGLCEPSARRGGYLPAEEGVHAFDRLVARGLREALEKDA
jgi:Rieske 2Fe-2S family protein